MIEILNSFSYLPELTTGATGGLCSILFILGMIGLSGAIRVYVCSLDKS